VKYQVSFPARTSYHRCYGYIINCAFESKLIWYFTGIYIINRIFITYWLMDMNFIFSCSTRYLTYSLRSLVRYRVDHSKVKFISTHGHVISSIYLIFFMIVSFNSWCDVCNGFYQLNKCRCNHTTLKSSTRD